MRNLITLLAFTGLALSAPVAINSESQTIGHPPSSVNMDQSELPMAFSVPSLPTLAHQKRDGRWPWQKEQDVIGKYPDGRLKCRIVSMTG
ncbi:uncharacterized protein N0V89_010597 [Didymosphaeria variabile]|uniref:Uncharacterized protein n=1 Tax=Didymosphaeria variabile TaxID=1932322 RepID=A0A9W8XDL9_9PLEO|nr:uncharacterized protein N0V89_010597 [Didymosphaeria variabile]KAJ4346666.1 hypothetical protein N0V89_010597 [Didymosphaeria variabile]